jgi:DNA-binding transcriptional regulator YdaS (Cro superfamily)
MKDLATYLAENGISQKAFAALIGADPSVVSRFVSRAAKPGLELAMKIEDATGGAVSARSWLPPSEDPQTVQPGTLPDQKDVA